MDLFPARDEIAAKALLIGERIELRALGDRDVLHPSPLTLRVGAGVATVFRYGAVVFFELDAPTEAEFLVALAPHVSGRFDAPVSDDAEIHIDPQGRERVEPDGTLVLRDTTLERIQVLAYVLARSALLSHYEFRIDRLLDRIETPVENLRRLGRSRLAAREIVRQLGEILVNEMRTVMRAEVSEKPELTWERPDLDRLYVHLAEEYELEERDRALSRKLELLSRTASTFLDLLQSRRSLHVEWYIVALIAVELLFLFYERFERMLSG